MTIISKKREIVFVHIPKCGGTSVEKAYAKHSAWGDLVLGSTKKGEVLHRIYRRYNGLHKHNTARDLRDKLGAELWSRYRTVAVVRNPQKIAESFYKYADMMVKRYLRRHNIGLDEFRRRVAHAKSLNWFVKWDYTRRYVRAQNFQEYISLSLQENVRIQTIDYVTDAAGEFMVDHILKLESPQEINAVFRDITGVTDFSIGHENKGTELGQLEWDKTDLEQFKEFNYDAYVRFGYEL